MNIRVLSDYKEDGHDIPIPQCPRCCIEPTMYVFVSKNNELSYRMRCFTLECDLKTDFYDSPMKVIKAWNREVKKNA